MHNQHVIEYLRELSRTAVHMAMFHAGETQVYAKQIIELGMAKKQEARAQVAA